MTAYETDRPRRKLPLVLILLAVIAVAVLAAAFAFRARLEGEPPQIRFASEADVVGVAPLEITVADAGAGLRSLTVTLAAGGGAETTLASEQFAQPVGEKKLSLALAKVAGIKEGPVTLRVVARDASLRGFLSGNEATVQKSLTVDLTPPKLDLVADDRYITFGGAGAIVYQASADAVQSGVRVGRHFFPGFRGVIKDQPERLFALFAHPYDSADAKAVLVATDRAGNTREMPLAYELKNVKYRKSTLPVSERFLQAKVVPLLADAAARQGSPKEVFVAVNRKLRKENDDRIAAITQKASPAIQWEGAFAQLTNSKVEANFADHRTYVYDGEPIDEAYHLGYDLSVTKRYPVEAANSGTVAFAGDLGIYGSTVILDHGLGLFTLYSHLSAIDVKEGDKLRRQQILGRTGETGLAAGDHLHYGVYLHGVAVLPVEWWDGKWIRDNIGPKLEGRSSEEAAAAQPARARAGTRKRR